jgi:hypothetical protein
VNIEEREIDDKWYYNQAYDPHHEMLVEMFLPKER